MFLLEGMAFTTLDSFEKQNPNWDVTPLKEPVLEKGEIVHFAPETVPDLRRRYRPDYGLPGYPAGGGVE